MKKSGKDCYYRFNDGDVFYFGKYVSKDKDMQY